MTAGKPLRKRLATPAAMVVLALLLRLVVVVGAQTYRIDSDSDHLDYAYEAGHIARSLVEGHGFSSPFGGNTGPSAYLPPFYAFLVAGIFKIFGLYSVASALVLLSLDCLASALTCWTTYRIAEQIVGVRIARWAGWFWALSPYSIYWAVRTISEAAFSALFLSLAVLVMLKVEREPSLRNWIWFGLAWGVLALENPSCLSLLPLCGIWLAWRLKQTGRPWFAGAAASALIFFAVITPWTVRNYLAFHKFIPIRGNLGIELRLGNSETSDGQWMSWLPPTASEEEFAKYSRMGELRYAEMRKQEVYDFVRRDPARFIRLCVRRFFWYWTGAPRSSTVPMLPEAWTALFTLSTVIPVWGLCLMIRNRRPCAWLFTTFLMVYPCIYYLTFALPRYRHPIEPMMTIAGLYVLAVALPESRDASVTKAGRE